ncbi:cytochrome P450 [Hyalangium versicolor]|uniref:cytochrome P450 n=1 Tax=Hyalangium versicolor TaxID=2861190 RepID=UPI001CC9A72A|nr:cytochrome P450 [Hyalangium versicolor]
MGERPNLLDPEVRANPYPLYARLRQEAPVCQVDPRGMWLLTRHEEVTFALKHPELFSSSALSRALEVGWLGRAHPLASGMSFADPPRHGRLRGLVQQAFTPAALAGLEPFVRSVVEPLVTNLLERRQVDFIQEFCMPLASSVIGQLLGLDTFLFKRVKRWAEVVAAMSSVSPQDTARQEQVRTSVEELRAYLEEVIDARRHQPREDTVSALVQARVEGEALTQEELLSFLFLLLVAGMETTVVLLGSAMRLLRERPEVFSWLRADTGRVPRFVEEVLRYEPPVQGPLRVATQEVELAGVRIPAGALVMPVVASALRDEQHVTDGERFDPERDGYSLLAFGHGIHFCLGAPLARLEARVALEVLLPQCAGLGGESEQVVWSKALAMRGPAVLPIELFPANQPT